MKKELKSRILSADKSADKSADGRPTVGGVNVIAVLHASVAKSLNNRSGMKATGRAKQPSQIFIYLL